MGFNHGIVDNEGHYLAYCAYNVVTGELSLSKACRANRFDKTTYFVYTPEDFTKKADNYHQDSSDFELSNVLLIVVSVVHMGLKTGTKSHDVVFYVL